MISNRPRHVLERPELPFVFMSGYLEDAAARRDITGENVAFLHKPWPLSGLLSAVGEAIATGAKEPGRSRP